MYNTSDLITSFATETAIIKHLAGKIPAEKYDFTPGEGMRTIKELLEYMARMGTAPIELLNWYDPEKMMALRIATQEWDVTKNFTDMMDDQLAVITKFLEGTTEEFMNETIELFGNEQSRKDFFLHVGIKNFPAYRMQLFMYLKGWLGMTELNTSNLWMGMDSESKA